MRGWDEPPRGLLDPPRILGFLLGEHMHTPPTQSFPGIHSLSEDSRRGRRPGPCPQCIRHSWEAMPALTFPLTAVCSHLGRGG